MLDYAANATKHWPSSKMREAFASSCNSIGLDPEEKLAEFLGGETDPEEFWQMADKNLKDRRLRLLFVADAIPSELQNIVEFLNEQMEYSEVLAIEIKHYVSGQGLRSLVPRVIGQTAKAQETKASGSRLTTTEEEFFTKLQDRSPEAADVARRILDWSQKHFTLVEWKGVSFVPKLDYGSEFTHNPITVFGLGKRPRVGIKFGRMKKRNGLPDGTRLELLRRLNDIPGVNLTVDVIDKYPTIPLDMLIKNDALEKFLQTIFWTIEEVRGVSRLDALSQTTK